MTPEALLTTSGLMGLFVLAGGSYGGLYSIGRLRARQNLIRASVVCWLVTMLLAVIIAAATPLEFGWKLLILASAVVYLVIPPVTWRYLQRLHAQEEHES